MAEYSSKLKLYSFGLTKSFNKLLKYPIIQNKFKGIIANYFLAVV